MIHEGFEADVATVLSALDEDGPPTPQQREAAKRVFASAMFAMVTVPQSLERIAKAGEALAAQGQGLLHRPASAGG